MHGHLNINYVLCQLPSVENSKSIKKQRFGRWIIPRPPAGYIQYLKPTHLGPVDKSAITLWAIRVPLTSLKLYLRDIL
jgi:hypothetical protein